MNASIDFLRRKGILDSDKTQWLIRFQDGREFDVVNLLSEFESNFKFGLEAFVRINFSQEWGQIVARAQYSNAENSYLIRYQAGDGRAVEAWWGESALEAK